MHDLHGMDSGMTGSWVLCLMIPGIFVWILIKAVSQNNLTSPSGLNSARDILKERYARGKISKEEYDEKQKIIS